MCNKLWRNPIASACTIDHVWQRGTRGRIILFTLCTRAQQGGEVMQLSVVRCLFSLARFRDYIFLI